MICPLSTVVGKGTWGEEEGIETLYNLSLTAASFVNNPLNFQRVQVAWMLAYAFCALSW